MAKVHLQGNAGNTQAPFSICSAKPIGNGKVNRNNRSKYQFMASEIVKFAEFKNVPADDRCVHCMDMGLEMKNRQRKAKGLAPVTHLFE